MHSGWLSAWIMAKPFPFTLLTQHGPVPHSWDPSQPLLKYGMINFFFLSWCSSLICWCFVGTIEYVLHFTSSYRDQTGNWGTGRLRSKWSGKSQCPTWDIQDPSAEESQLSRSLCIQYLEASVTAVRAKHFSRSQPGHSPWAYEKYRKSGQWEILGLNNFHSFMEDPCLTGGLTITALACF